jgi:hypothetical protein
MAEQEMLQAALAAEVVLAMEVETLEILELQVNLEETSLQTLDLFKLVAAAVVVVLVPQALLV